MFNVMRLDDRLEATFAEPRFYSLTLGLFAALALATSVLGVYGVLSYSVERRRVEFGVRRALGGGERHILALVLRQAAGLIAIGLAMGLTLAAFGTSVLRSLLFGVQAVDPATFVVAAIAVAAVGLTAAAVPAWRAINVDPITALRTD
jgi:ABC-type antimicrobial peptide transport system permease subunit